MICLDSIKLSVRNEALKDYKKLEFDEKTNLNKKTGVIRTAQVMNNISELGLKYIAIGETETQIEVSSKILKQNYLSGINKNTQEQLVHEINATKLIEFDTNNFLENAVVYRADITDNIRPKDLNKSILDLQIYSAGNKYKIDQYHTGIIVTSKRKTNTERMVFYDKYSEVTKKNKQNEELAKVFNIELAKDVFRVESNNRSFQALRDNLQLNRSEKTQQAIYGKVHQLATPYLKDVLESQSKVNYNKFLKMFEIIPEETEKQFRIVHSGEIDMLIDSGYKQYQIEKELGMRAIIECYNYNFEAIRRLLYTTTKSRNYRKEKQYLDLIKVMKLEKLNYDKSSIYEIRELLKAS